MRQVTKSKLLLYVLQSTTADLSENNMTVVLIIIIKFSIHK